MNLIIMIDDCPRTRRFLKHGYCSETKCVYFCKKQSDESIRACSHPKAQPSETSVMVERLNWIAEGVKNATEKNIRK